MTGRKWMTCIFIPARTYVVWSIAMIMPTSAKWLAFVVYCWLLWLSVLFTVISKNNVWAVHAVNHHDVSHRGLTGPAVCKCQEIRVGICVCKSPFFRGWRCGRGTQALQIDLLHITEHYCRMIIHRAPCCNSCTVPAYRTLIILIVPFHKIYNSHCVSSLYLL